MPLNSERDIKLQINAYIACDEARCWKQYTHTRFCIVPSVWCRGRFGEGRGRSIRAEEDITKDPLEPIPVALKWDLLSDLKLVYPNFRTPEQIDLLLGDKHTS